MGYLKLYSPANVKSGRITVQNKRKERQGFGGEAQRRKLEDLDIDGILTH